MRALNGLLLLAIALSVLPSSAGALELGPCEPAEAVKIIDTSLGQGKTLQQAMQMMIKAKVFDVQGVHHLHPRDLDEHARFIPKSL